MRHIILIVLLALYAPTFAQPVLTAANSSPQPGDVLINQLCDTTGITEGSAGAVITWDFSTINTTGIIDTFFYTNQDDPIDSLYANQLSACNLVKYHRNFRRDISGLISADYHFVFYHINDDSVNELGTTNSQYGVGVFVDSPPHLCLKYPASYLSTFSRLYSEEVSGDTFVTISYLAFDAYGRLKLPGIEYASALRMQYKSRYSYCQDYAGVIGCDSSFTDSFAWFVPGIHDPVFGVTNFKRKSSTASASTVIAERRVILTRQIFTAGTKELMLTTNTPILYPNPASKLTTLSITVPVAGMVSIDIYDAQGRHLKQLTQEYYAPGKHNIPIATSDLPLGMYFVHVRVNSEVQVVKLVVE